MSLSDPPSVIMSDFLIDQGVLGDPLASSLSYPLYTSSLPDGDNIPDDAAAVYDSVGIKDGRLMSGPNIFHHGFQIVVRSEDYQTGWDKAEAVAAVLEAVKNTSHTMGGSGGNAYTLNSVSQATPPIPFNEEGTKRRFLFTLNFLVTITE